ncbi:hypothetical protein D3C81_900490 [compost metagenome]
MSSFIESVITAIHKRNPDVAIKFQRNYRSGPSLSNMNGYLRTQLGLLPVNTTNERECLMDNVTEKEWLRLFSKHVAPTIVAYGLPDWK